MENDGTVLMQILGNDFSESTHISEERYKDISWIAWIPEDLFEMIHKEITKVKKFYKGVL